MHEPCWGEAQNLKGQEILEILGISDREGTDQRDAAAKVMKNRARDNEMR